MNRFIFLFATLGILLLSACGGTEQEANAIQEEQLLGHWEVQEATRNGSPTESLDGLYFVFNSGGELLTNVSGMPAEGTFEVEGSTIHQRNTGMDADYSIQDISESNLVLTTKLRDFDFRFVLTKQILEE